MVLPEIQNLFHMISEKLIFQNMEIFLITLQKIFKYLCPKLSDFFIRSNYNSEKYEIIEINLNKCTEGD